MSTPQQGSWRPAVPPQPTTPHHTHLDVQLGLCSLGRRLGAVRRHLEQILDHVLQAGHVDLGRAVRDQARTHVGERRASGMWSGPDADQQEAHSAVLRPSSRPQGAYWHNTMPAHLGSAPCVLNTVNRSAMQGACRQRPPTCWHALR